MPFFAGLYIADKFFMKKYSLIFLVIPLLLIASQNVGTHTSELDISALPEQALTCITKYQEYKSTTELTTICKAKLTRHVFVITCGNSNDTEATKPCDLIFSQKGRLVSIGRYCDKDALGFTKKNWEASALTFVE